MSGANAIPQKRKRNNWNEDLQERKTKHAPGPETKGGGYHGGPKRWTGRGPAPARHIPWPEIFRHHISLVEGHLKMVDMVRKHTVEGTGNWTMIVGCLERAQEMLATSKQISRNFVPPPNQREQVPIGVSSASMYPGYSPADHEYGQAAEEFGRYASEAKMRGEEVKLPGIDYEFGQGKGIKRKTLTEIRAAQEAKERGSGSGSGSGSDNPVKSAAQGEPSTTKSNGAITNGNTEPAITSPEPQEGGDNPYFVVDTQPMKINLPHALLNQQKRSASSDPQPSLEESKEHKKAKKSHEGDLPTGEGYEDINDEVDAKLKEKEEKKKRKEERKRKRESAGEAGGSTQEANMTTTTEKTEAEPSPQKKKKKRKATTTETVDHHPATLSYETSSPKRAASPALDGTGEPAGTPKKKKVKTEHTSPTKSDANGTESKKRSGDADAEEDGEGGKKKKRKKAKGEGEKTA